jgi:hypothetical protein
VGEDGIYGEVAGEATGEEVEATEATSEAEATEATVASEATDAEQAPEPVHQAAEAATEEVVPDEGSKSAGAEG